MATNKHKVAGKQNNRISVNDITQDRELPNLMSKKQLMRKYSRGLEGKLSSNLLEGVSTEGGKLKDAVLQVAYSGSSSKYDSSSLLVAESELGIGSGQYYELDSLDLMAIHIIDYVMAGTVEFPQLSLTEQNILFRYFYRHNPVLGRIIDLHTNLPTSKIRNQVPRNCPEIVRDFINQFYQDFTERVDLTEHLRQVIRNRFLYGIAHVLIDDIYEGDRILQNIEEIKMNPVVLQEEDKKYIATVEDLYSKDPDSVTVETRFEYMKRKFSGNFEHDYKGPKRVRVIDFWEIDENLENRDIDFKAIKIITPDGLKKALQAVPRDLGASDSLYDLGYSKGMIELLAVNQELGINVNNVLLIDNDDLAGIPFILVLEGESIVRRVVKELFEWEMAKRAFIAKIKRMGKNGRLVTSEGLSVGQIDFLRAEVDTLLEDVDYSIVANFPIQWENVETLAKEELNELAASTDRLTEQLALGLGIPITMLSGESQYSGDSVKLEVLNTEYLSLKLTLQDLISRKLYKPMALRKGLLSFDSWGNPVTLYPKLTFSRVSIRDDSVYDMLFSLYQKGSLPVSIIYELLNLEVDDVERGIQEDLFTTKDPIFNEVLRDLYTNSSEEIFRTTDVVSRIRDSLRLQKKEVPGNEENLNY